MSKEYKVGVFLFAYNQGKYLDDAIESLKKQTYQNFEVILVDDASNDGFTPDKIRSIEYDKITKKVLHTTNLGSPKRRRQYDEQAKNEYVFHYCGDDMIDPTFLEKTVDFLDKHPKYGAVCTNLKIFREKIGDGADHCYNPDTMKLPYMLVSCNMLGSSVIRTKALREVNTNWPLRRSYDWNVWIAMLQAGWKLGLVPEPLFFYRQVSTSLSHSAKKEDEMAFRKELMKRYKSEYEKYSMEIITELYYKLTELQEAKDWLDGQYHSLNKEIDRLNGVIAEKDQYIDSLRREVNHNIGLCGRLKRRIAAKRNKNS